ncbi:hypothetical protein [Paenibacillus sp. NAIST15-1]|uniref:hypothetical protein n=1 Tax=Paenibacillus sp. NAIST15-1 TaxID=1605994 RepID=UPI0011150B60|nr:hypothetical protein [Paenibacillus sp. NAIST15-1]
MNNENESKLRSFYDFIQDLPEVTSIATYLNRTNYIPELKTDTELFFVSNELLSKYHLEPFQSSTDIYISENLNNTNLQKLNLPIADDKKQTVIHREFNIKKNLSSNIILWNGGTTSLQGAIYDKQNFIIAPIQNEQLNGKKYIERMSYNSIITLQKNSSFEQFNSKVNEYLSLNNISAKVYTIEQMIDQIKKQNSTLIFISISLGIILTCLSMIGFIGIIFMSIKKRLTDLAILYIHGSSISILLLSLFFEFTCQLIIASSISYFISYLLTHLINDTPISLLTFGISSSLFFIIGIIITFFIRNKLSRTELIRSIKEVY